MRNKKGRRKVYLFNIRNKKKLSRNKIKGNKVRALRKYSDNQSGLLKNSYKKVVQRLSDCKFGYRYKNEQSVETLKMPTDFSFFDDAESVIKVLRKMYSVAMNVNTKKIIFDHSECRNLGLAASTCMDVIFVAVKRHRKTMHNELDCEGILSLKSDNVNDILLASGLPYHLDAYSTKDYDKNKVAPFKIVSGQNTDSSKEAATVATKLTEYFNKCLRTQNYEINDEGKRLFSRIFGEVINNCEIHGGKEATWYTQGHYQIIDKDSYGEMQLLFMNIGDTIAEGLEKHSSAETQKKLQHILNKHRKYKSKDWTQENIYTVFALQEGISRLRNQNVKGYESRGSGTVSMIEKFYELGRCEKGLTPQMTIVSGNTQIVFTEKYKMKLMNFSDDPIFESGEKKIIAFNEDNDIYSRPDKSNVKRMKEYFPGTIISLKFYLDGKYIAKRKEKV